MCLLSNFSGPSAPHPINMTHSPVIKGQIISGVFSEAAFAEILALYGYCAVDYFVLCRECACVRTSIQLTCIVYMLV